MGKLHDITKFTSRDDRVDFPHPLAPHKRTVTDSFLSRILENKGIMGNLQEIATKHQIGLWKSQHCSVNIHIKHQSN